MKSLAAARLLWSDGAALPLDALAALVPASDSAVARAVARLCALGIAEVSGRTVRLTELGAREICDRGGAAAEVRPSTTAA
jgi:hypothetical protein